MFISPKVFSGGIFWSICVILDNIEYNFMQLIIAIMQKVSNTIDTIDI